LRRRLPHAATGIESIGGVGLGWLELPVTVVWLVAVDQRLFKARQQLSRQAPRGDCTRQPPSSHVHGSR